MLRQIVYFILDCKKHTDCEEWGEKCIDDVCQNETSKCCTNRIYDVLHCIEPEKMICFSKNFDIGY